MKLRNLTYVLLTVLMFNCSYNNEDDLVEDDPVVEEMVTYNGQVKSIIDTNCIACHNNPPVNGAPMSLITYQDLRNAVENGNLMARISTNDIGAVMPPGGPRLPQNLIDLIAQWQADGFLEN
jgi:mono/diheme cytochrome c family protein